MILTLLINRGIIIVQLLSKSHFNCSFCLCSKKLTVFVTTASKRLIQPDSRHLSQISTANLNRTINSYIRRGSISDAHQVFDQNPISRDIVSWNSIISGYVKHNQISRAQQLFDQMPARNAVSWNTMLSISHKAKNPEKVYVLFLQMLRASHKPCEFTFSPVISAFVGTGFSVLLPQLHGLILHLGLNTTVYVGSVLMRGYADLRDSDGLRQVFGELLVKDVATWNVLILGFTDLGLTDEAQTAIGMMPVTNVVSWTILVNGYINNGRLDVAWSVFSKLSEKNVLTWTAMIRGYVQYGKYLDALDLFILMKNTGPCPNNFTFSSVLEACAGISSLVMGNQVHSCILKFGIPLDVILLTSLADMYAKCGDIEAAYCVFESMREKSVVSWNSIIGGYARHGLATRALEMFERMTDCSVKPNEITFINVLSACVHVGLVEEGERLFNSMGTKYGVQAEREHYACMVDLFGRAGELDKAKKLIREMPFEPDVVVWGALLGACGLHSCPELGEFAVKGLNRLKQDSTSVYSTLSKMHCEKGGWNRAIEAREMMNQKRIKKQKAVSWIDSPSATQ